ncbi:MAG: lamin tail domain-containing protein, partial [Thermoguttaceae bacterium]
MLGNSRRKAAGRSGRFGRLCYEPLEPRLVLDSTVVFNEIMYNPQGDTDDTLEWIELYNTLAVDVDISEWSIEGGIDYKFPDPTSIPGRGFLVLAIDPAALEADSGYDGALGPFDARLSNGGEEIRLINNDGREMNVLDYGDGGKWSVGPDGGGPSLAKRDREAATKRVDNWTFSLQVGGTPGSENFPSQDDPPVITSIPIIDAGSDWKFLDDGSDQGVAWYAPGFNDSQWDEGPAQLGFGDGDEATLIEFGPDDQNKYTTTYFRRTFEYTGDPAELDDLTIDIVRDDGSIVYINGHEGPRSNMPSGPVNYKTLSGTNTGSENAFRNLGSIDPGWLVQGENVIAVEIHQKTLYSTDLSFDLKMSGLIVEQPDPVVDGLALVFNEVASANDAEFFVELANIGTEPLDLDGFVLRATGTSGGTYVFPPGMLDPGQLLAVSQQQLGFHPADGAKLFFYTPDQGQLVDARGVTGRLRGRPQEDSAQHDGRWLYPAEPTPGQPNAFNFHDEIVINEIMYHATPTLAKPGTPSTYQTTTLLAIDATTTWRYNRQDDDLPAGWARTVHPVDGDHWLEGAGVFGYEPSALPEPIRTPFPDPRSITPFIITHYFETEFEFNGDLNDVDLQVRHIIDDGAIFYLNGVELPRYRMNSGTVHSETLSGPGVSNAKWVGPTSIPTDALVIGTNRLSVEVHQQNTSSSDVVFGLELKARTLISPGTPGTPMVESSEEWIELYNRGGEPVDLGEWKLADAIDYEFEPGTMIDPDEYLVVAADATALRGKYPGVRIVGNFGRGLSNKEDNVVLVDPAKNPADEVHYYERGRWPEYADGGGSSLELRNPDADNSKGEAWAASDETSRSEWKLYKVRGVSEEPLEVSTVYNEFIFGLLDSGEFLMDDVSVVLRPGGTNQQMIQNRDFEADTPGQPPATYRLIGTHSGLVEADTDVPGNQVLHVVAAGPQQHIHDHVETTFVGNTPIQDGQEYEISFRAKWLGGNSQLNNRFYFTRMGNTIQLDVPELSGTPGERNSTYQANIGPTYDGLGHAPVLPTAGQSVTVSVSADDTDGMKSMTLWYGIDGTTWSSKPMTANTDGVYSATIPAQSSGTVVQFYVEGEDTLGFRSYFPAAGRDSRALYQVGNEATRPIDTIRLVLLSSDRTELRSSENRMSNNYVGGTVIRNATEAFYDIEIRQVGSRWIRPNSGDKIRLNPEHKLYGVHDSFRLDRSGGGTKELYMKQMVNRAGGSSVSHYDDIAYVTSPYYTGIMLMQLARYEDAYLDEQFDNGTQGTKYELDDITFPTLAGGAGVESIKTSTGTSAQDIHDRGDNPESYRGQILIKNHRQADDFSKIVDMAQAIHLTGDALYEATNEVMDVDLWMRHYATQAFLGNWDTYGFRRPKNLRIFIRPEDGKVIPLYWDADLANLTEPLIYNGGASRLDEIRDIPQNLRLFWGHMWDLVNRSFKREYIEPWINHYVSLGANIGGDIVGKVQNRVTQVRDAARAAILPVTFAITSNQGNPISVEETSVTLAGDGWIDVREIKLRLGTDPVPVWSDPLDVTWTDEKSWEVLIPLAAGPNAITLGAFDFEGNPIGTSSIAVESTLSDRPLEDHLRVGEIHYHPAPPNSEEAAAGFDDQDDFEFIELVNTSTQLTLDLITARLADEIVFDFSTAAVTSLAPGQRVVVARNSEAFTMRYGGGVNLAGYYTGGLGNGGDSIHLMAGPVTIQQFAYGDSGDANWPDRADGKGSSLEVIDPSGDYDDGRNWHSSREYGGSPAYAGAGQVPGIVVNEVLSHSNPTNLDTIELFNPTNQTIDISGWYLSDKWGWPGVDDPGGDGDYKKFRIPDATVLAPGAYVTFDETDFNPNGPWNPDPDVRGENEFALDGAHGDDVWLMAADTAGNLTHFVDHVEFDGAVGDESFGRWPNGTAGLYPMESLSLGEVNPGPRVGPLVISELMYMPPDPDGPGGIDPSDLEYIEIYNPLGETVPLADWRFRGGIKFDFAEGMQIEPRSTLVVLPFDFSTNTAKWATFATTYGLDPANTSAVVGGYTGFLDNGGESVRLLRPDTPPLEEPDFTPHTLEDAVRYDNNLPWPPSAVGLGDSLNRLDARLWGPDSGSWGPAGPTPGAVLLSQATVVGRHIFYNRSDFDGNDPAPNGQDDNAIAPDKQALLPDQTASVVNYTNYGRGINGIMIDVFDLPEESTLSEVDFRFRMGHTNDPNTWAAVLAPTEITVRRGEGTEGADRVTIVWPDNAIERQWLQ